MSEDERLIADQFEGIPAPQDSTFLIGHEEEAARFAQEHWALSRSEIESYVMPNALLGSLGSNLNGATA